MANIIKVGNTVNGYTTTPDQSGALEIRTGLLAGGTPAITVDASQNVTLAANTTVAGNLAVTGTITGAAGLGVGQTWQNVLASRASGVTYTNTTGKPIMVSIYTNVNAANTIYWTFFVSGVMVLQAFGGGGASAYYYFPCVSVIPAGATYVFTSVGGGIASWAELR